MRNRGRAASPAGALPAGLLVALLAVVTGGCGGSGGRPVTLPSLPSPAGSPTPSPSAAPSGIDAPTPQGAAAFARFFYAEVERAFAERDPTLIARLSEPTCESCTNYVTSIREIRDSGQRVEGFTLTVREAVAPADIADNARVDVIWDAGANVLYDKNGRVLSRERATRGIEVQMNLVRRQGAWRVASLDRIRVRG